VQQVLIADQPAGPAADRIQVADGQVHPVLGLGTDVVVRARGDGELADLGPQEQFHGGQLLLPRTDQGQHHDLARFPVLAGGEIVDRLEVEFLV
jgi:hypothetical protein